MTESEVTEGAAVRQTTWECAATEWHVGNLQSKDRSKCLSLHRSFFFINASHIEFPHLVKTHPTLKLKNPPTIGITVRDGYGNACGIKDKQQ